jgi:hypothetical protein
MLSVVVVALRLSVSEAEPVALELVVAAGCAAGAPMTVWAKP